MTEPVHTSNPIPKSSERLKNILEALRSYHEHVLQTNTLQSQSPVNIKNTERILRLKSKDIKMAIDQLYHTTPNVTPDDQFNKCIETLRNNLTPWSPEYSTLAKYWCELMFETHPFTLSQDHINTFYKNSEYIEDIENDKRNEKMPEGIY